MAVATFVYLLVRLLNIHSIDHEASWRSGELFFNGVGFSVFALFGALETWYVCGYFAGTDYMSPLDVKTGWIVAAACAFANALLHLLAMGCAGLVPQKD